MELGQGGLGPIGARGLRRGAAPQSHPLLLEGAHLDRTGRNRLEPARWSMDLFHYLDWKGRWIGLDRAFLGDDELTHTRLLARYFREEFKADKPVTQVTASIIGLELYELYLNGQHVGDQGKWAKTLLFTRVQCGQVASSFC